MSEQAVRNNVLQQFVERASSLYTLPAVAMEVLELTQQPRVDTTALKACVERDPALTGKLLRVVNSSMFGLRREVSDLNQALALLGVKPLKLLVLGFSLPRELYNGLEAEILRRYWQFTLLKAVAARELCQAFWKQSGDEAFIAGLLQEIGILVLVQELGDSYVNFLNSAKRQGEDLISLEAETLGFDHAILSARLLDHWNLPAQIVSAVAEPHDLDRLVESENNDLPLPQMLHLATLIASIIVDGRHEVIAELVEAASQYRQITVKQIDDLLDQMQERVDLMANVLSVQVDRQEPYRDILARAHRQMADAAVDALPDMLGGSMKGDRAGTLVEESEALSNALQAFAQGECPPHSGRSLEPATSTDCTVATGVIEPIASSSDPGLQGRVAAAISACRARLCELSLVLLEIDEFENLILVTGPDRVDGIVASMQQAIRALSDLRCETYLAGDGRYAILVAECDRQQAVTLARTLIEEIPVWFVERGDSDTLLRLSAGVASFAMPSRGSQPQDLIDAADRCLFAARASGGRVVKSIDVI